MSSLYLFRVGPFLSSEQRVVTVQRATHADTRQLGRNTPGQIQIVPALCGKCGPNFVISSLIVDGIVSETLASRCTCSTSANS